jgi:hypothetical protein
VFWVLIGLESILADFYQAIWYGVGIRTSFMPVGCCPCTCGLMTMACRKRHTTTHLFLRRRPRATATDKIVNLSMEYYFYSSRDITILAEEEKKKEKN